GDQDKLIPVATAENFRDTLRNAKVKSELIVYEGQTHGFFNHGRNDNRFYRATVIASDRFLTELGWLSGSPSIAE
ncbi:dienelactone hydrolase family protein, partial [Rubripirellula sp.]|nr:dienelactone hydrolase family protein [Rubripirellula sp.]